MYYAVGVALKSHRLVVLAGFVLMVAPGTSLAAEIIGSPRADSLKGTASDDVIYVGPKQGELEVLTGEQEFAAGNGETVPAYSRDGSVLYYSLVTWGEVPTYKYIPGTGVTSVVGVGSEPKSSANGKSFASQTTLERINLYDPSANRRSLDGPYEHISWVSNDGLKVSFASGAQPYFWNAQTGLLRRIDTNAANQVANDGSWWAMLSSDARYAVFSSAATNLVVNDTNGARDIFLKDLQTEAITRVSKGWNGVQSNGDSGGYGWGGGQGRNRGLDASEDLDVVVFQSKASNLVPSDGNGSVSDIFIQNLKTGERKLVSLTYDGQPANGDSTNPAVSSNGRFVVFDSEATNLVPNDTNGFADTFVVDTLWKTIVRINVSADGTQANGGTVWWNFNDISSDGKTIVFETNADNIFSQTVSGGRNVGIAHLKFDEASNYVFGGSGNDLIFGQDGSDQLNGDGGNDVIYGGGGNDVEQGGDGADALIGENGADSLSGGAGSDLLKGGLGNDTFYGNKSGVIGTEVDTVSYEGITAPVTFNLSVKTVQVTGGAGSDRIPDGSVENLIGGSASDRLTGSAGGNRIEGGKGNDIINGLSGPDTLVGGPGKDIIDCGAEPSNNIDTVVYSLASDSPVGTGRDEILNLKAGDKINLSAIDANTAVSGDQAFLFNSKTPRANSIWYTNIGADIIVKGSVNGKTAANFEILVKGRTSLAATDFIR